MSKTQNKRYKSSKSRTRKNGGAVLASGGFGCVFSPALLCKGQTKRKRNMVSKLMTERHALEEYRDISKIRDRLKSIPNYKDFFLVDDISVCTPKPLAASDLSNFKNKCTALPKDDITVDNINDSLDRLLSLNIPNGGIDIDDYIFKNGAFNKLLNLNTKLINLLNNGILPMNKHNIYHCDIKGTNILIDPSLKTRLIDWGLCAQYKPFEQDTIPNTWYNRPLQYNVPFSVILFTNTFKEKYKGFIASGGKSERNELRIFVWDYIQEWKKIRGIGHYRVINDIMYMLFSNDLKINQSLKWNLVEKKYTIPYIVNYLVEVLIHYKQTNSDIDYDFKPYLNEVFVNIVDIWGFLSTYTTIIEVLFNNYNVLNENEVKLFNLIKKILVEYMYRPRIKPIDISNLTNELSNLNTIFIKGFNFNNKKLIYEPVNVSSKISYKRKNKKARRAQPLLLLSKKSKSLINEVAKNYM